MSPGRQRTCCILTGSFSTKAGIPAVTNRGIIKNTEGKRTETKQTKKLSGSHQDVAESIYQKERDLLFSDSYINIFLGKYRTDFSTSAYKGVGMYIVPR